MRATHVLAASAAILAFAAAPAAAEPKPQPPQGAIGNVGFVANLPELKRATAINFLQYRKRDVMLATGRFGLRSYDISNPRKPRFLDAVDNEALRLQGDPPVDTDDSDEQLSTFWQNEDMDVDARIAQLRADRAAR